jgi:hypothetical protein
VKTGLKIIMWKLAIDEATFIRKRARKYILATRPNDQYMPAEGVDDACLKHLWNEQGQATQQDSKQFPTVFSWLALQFSNS